MFPRYRLPVRCNIRCHLEAIRRRSEMWWSVRSSFTFQYFYLGVFFLWSSSSLSNYGGLPWGFRGSWGHRGFKVLLTSSSKAIPEMFTWKECRPWLHPWTFPITFSPELCLRFTLGSTFTVQNSSWTFNCCVGTALNPLSETLNVNDQALEIICYLRLSIQRLEIFHI